MSWLGKLFGGAASPPPAIAAAQVAREAARGAAWVQALDAGTLPDFVTQRLGAAGQGTAPWLSTMTPGELLLCRREGVTPVAMVSGTCWYHFGYSWTNGHAEGWHIALDRMRQEAVAAGANAVVDVKMRTVRLPAESSMDYTLVGTAVKIAGLPPSPEPVIATVPAVEFARLLEAGIVPVGIAVGAHYEWLTSNWSSTTGAGSFRNQLLPELSGFWDGIRQAALRKLRADTQRLGAGVLAHTHFGQLLKFEGDDNRPTRFLGRFIVIGTVVSSRRRDVVPHPIRTVVDMRGRLSPLLAERPHGHNAYPVHNEKKGSI